MLSRLQEFLTRHRRKLIITGVVLGGTFFAIKYAQRKLLEFQERQARDFFEKTRRMQHFESTEHTCNQVIIGMGAELCQAILMECSTNELLEQLRHKPPNKLELWEEIKIVSFTRLATIIYASSMLVIALRVQMNLLGGYLYRDITLEQKQITDELKQEYLSLIRHFIQDGGVAELVRLIRSKVVGIMQQMPLTKRFSLADMEQLFWTIQMAINSDVSDPNSKMAKYLLPQQIPECCTSGPLLQKMFNETLDLLESDDAASVCSNNNCRGFSIAVDAISESLGDTILAVSNADAIKQQQQKTGENASDESTDEVAISTAATATDSAEGTTKSLSPQQQNNNNLLKINTVQIPLAKVIPVVSGITSKGFDSASRPQNLATSLITFFVVSEKSKVLGANVYETFSSS